jgi:hypothetical protein
MAASVAFDTIVPMLALRRFAIWLGQAAVRGPRGAINHCRKGDSGDGQHEDGRRYFRILV